jgi:predicted aspartyl protease
MKYETRFNSDDSLIIVEIKVCGPRGEIPVIAAVDTGTTITTLVPEVLDLAGCSARDGGRATTVTTANGIERGYIFKLPRFSALGTTEEDFLVHVFQLHEKLGVDGLLGLNFLRRFNYEVRPIEGRILVERAAA